MRPLALLLALFTATACDPADDEPLTLADYCEPVDENDESAGYLCDPEDLEAYAAATGDDSQFRFALPGSPNGPCVKTVHGQQVWGFNQDCEQDAGP